MHGGASPTQTASPDTHTPLYSLPRAAHDYSAAPALYLRVGRACRHSARAPRGAQAMPVLLWLIAVSLATHLPPPPWPC